MIKINENIYDIEQNKPISDEGASPLDAFLPKSNSDPSRSAPLTPTNKESNDCYEFLINITWKSSGEVGNEQNSIKVYVHKDVTTINYPDEKKKDATTTLKNIIESYIESPGDGHVIDDKVLPWGGVSNVEVISFTCSVPVKVDCRSDNPAEDPVQPAADNPFNPPIRPSSEPSEISGLKIRTGKDCDPKTLDVTISAPNDDLTDKILPHVTKVLKKLLTTRNILKFMPLNIYSNINNQYKIIPLKNPPISRDYTVLVTERGITFTGQDDAIISCQIGDEIASFTFLSLNPCYSLDAIHENEQINIIWNFLVDLDVSAKFKIKVTFKCKNKEDTIEADVIFDINFKNKLNIILKSPDSIKATTMHSDGRVFADSKSEYALNTTAPLFHTGTTISLPEEKRKILHDIKPMFDAGCQTCGGSGKLRGVKCARCKGAGTLTLETSLTNILSYSILQDSQEPDSAIIIKDGKIIWSAKGINDQLNKENAFQQAIDQKRREIETEEKVCDCCLISLSDITMQIDSKSFQDIANKMITKIKKRPIR